MKLNVFPLMQAIGKYIAKEDSDLEEQLELEGYVAADIAVEHITSIEDSVTEAVQERVDKVLEQLQGAVDINNFIEKAWPDITDEEVLKKALHDIFHEQFDDLMHQFTINWIISEDPGLAEAINDGRITKPAEAFIKGWSSELAELMHLNTNKQIEKILLDAQENSRTIEEVAKTIADSGIRECGYRSRRVAVTEVLRVSSYAHQEAMIQDPSCYKKRWIHVLSNEPRVNHMMIHGQEVFKREKFTLPAADGGTYYPLCPRDTCLPAGESINCHCRMEAVVDEDAKKETIEEKLERRKQYMDEVDAEYDAKLAQFYADGHNEYNSSYTEYAPYFT